MTDDTPAAVAGLLDARPLTPDDRAFHELRKALDRALEATRRVASLRVVAAVTHLARLVHSDPGDEINAAVRAALEDDNGPEAAWMLEDDNRTRGDIARDVRAVLRLAVAGLAPLLPDGLVTPDGLVAFEVMHGITSWPDSIPTEDTPTGPVTAWDAVFIRTLEAEELATPDEASALLAKRAQSYARHTAAGMPGDALAWWYSVNPEHYGAGRPVVLLGVLAERLWARRWREEARKLRERRDKEPALTVRTVRSMVGLMSPATVAEERDGEIVLVDPAGERHGLIDLSDLRDLMTGTKGGAVEPRVVRATAHELVRARRTVAGVHTFMHGIHTVTELVRAGADLRATWPSWHEWAGEVAGYAEISLTPDLRKDLYRMAWFGNTAQLDLFDGRTQRGLWLLRAPDPFKRGRPRKGDSRVVHFTYSDVLSPAWAACENPGDSNRGVRLMWLPPRLPVARGIASDEKAAAQLFALLVLAQVASGTKPRQVNDGAPLPAEDRERLATAAGLSLAYEPRQLAALVDAGVIARVVEDRYALAGEEAVKLAGYENTRWKARYQKGSDRRGKR